MKFKEIYSLFEKLSNKEKVKSKKEAILYNGRFQPFHIGHLLTAKEINKKFPKAKLVIGLIKGEKSSKDKTKNPLNVELQIKLIKKSIPSAEIVIFKNGFIPEQVLELRNKGYEIIGYISGPDRIEGYKKQLKYFDKIDEKDFEKPEIEIIEIKKRFKSPTGQEISATKVRNAIKENDIETFKNLTPKQIHKEFTNLRNFIK